MQVQQSAVPTSWVVSDADALARGFRMTHVRTRTPNPKRVQRTVAHNRHMRAGVGGIRCNRFPATPLTRSSFIGPFFRLPALVLTVAIHLSSSPVLHPLRLWESER